MNVLALFSTHYSLDGGSLLTLEEPGKAKPGNPVSVFDLAAQAKLTEVVVVDDRIDGAIQAYRVATKLGLQLIYGVKLTICADMADKTIESRRTESSVIVFIKDTEGYASLLRLWNRAWGREGNLRLKIRGDWVSYGRLDWKALCDGWTSHLVGALPFFSSFLAKNTLTFSQITPSLPFGFWVMREMESGLPFAGLIDKAIDRYVGQEMTGMVVPCKTIYYSTRKDLKPYVVFRAIAAGGTWDEPDCDHLHSAEFCWEAYRELAAR